MINYVILMKPETNQATASKSGENDTSKEMHIISKDKTSTNVSLRIKTLINGKQYTASVK